MKTALLIAEDDESVREMMDVILTQAGFQVSTTTNGEAALDLMKRSRFALVLLDIHMPHMSGLDVLAAMGRLAKPPPVLMVSANRASDTVSRAVGLGCCGYLAKPFSPDALIARVRRALEAPPAARPAVVMV